MTRPRLRLVLLAALAACAVVAITLAPAKVTDAICSLAGAGLRALAEVLVAHGLLVDVAVLAVSALVAHQLVKRVVAFIVARVSGRPADVRMIMKIVKAVIVVVVLLLLVNKFYRIEALLVALGAFTGLFLGWALQQPITGIAAWIFVNVKRPFRIGDRIYLPSLGLVGDVIDVGIFHTVLNQVGGTVGSEEASGRIVLVPNSLFFSSTIINYTYAASEERSYILDEVVVRLSFDSDWDVAERILVRAAEEVTRDIVEETGVRPYVRAELWDYGIIMRLRYYTRAKDRVVIAHEITKRIVKEFQRDDRVDFAIPFIYSFRLGEAMKRVRGARPLAPEPSRAHALPDLSAKPALERGREGEQ
ncbi:MAG: hypothetical protein DRJ56_04340 [Thermoprotei archaeon]|nr:MAG: hypothetical protein DRJ56_04340 [Thermoprotei archaeon]